MRMVKEEKQLPSTKHTGGLHGARLWDTSSQEHFPLEEVAGFLSAYCSRLGLRHKSNYYIYFSSRMMQVVYLIH